jgi:hypothetical protein
VERPDHSVVCGVQFHPELKSKFMEAVLKQESIRLLNRWSRRGLSAYGSHGSVVAIRAYSRTLPPFTHLAKFAGEFQSIPIHINFLP